MPGYDAIVLAGGKGMRLGGIDKAALEVGTRTLLDRALAAVQGAQRVVVVGPGRDVPPEVTVVTEDPPRGGPVAAVAAAAQQLRSGLVVVLACDMPFVTADTVHRLLAACRGDDDGAATSAAPHDAAPHDDAGSPTTASGPDGAMLVDSYGRPQYCAAAYRVQALLSALDDIGPHTGAAMRTLVGRLTVVEVAAEPQETLDCDTWDDVERSRALLEDR
jgi:molybdopterin-guanine dinucleotide biosynthesis protein A